MDLHRAEAPQQTVANEDLDKSRSDADCDHCDEHQAGGLQNRSASNDHRLPGDQQNERQPADAVCQGRDLGWDRGTCGEGERTSQRGSKEDDEQRHVRAATCTPQAADLADPFPDHRLHRRSGNGDAPG
jgi:hypothetical protein